MRKGIAIILLAALCVLSLSACGCKHEWQDATCQVPKTCSLCGKTDGDAVGAHSPGEWEQTPVPVRAEIRMYRRCILCDHVTEEKTEAMDSLIHQDLFAMTPREFMDRMAFLAEQRGISLEYAFQDAQELLFAEFLMGDKTVLVQFFYSDTTQMKNREMESAGLWCVSINMLGGEADFGSLIDRELCSLFFTACDPAIDEDGLNELVLMKTVSAMNSAQGSNPFGYHIKNGVLYEYGHMLFDRSAEMTSIENIQAYASDWR